MNCIFDKPIIDDMCTTWKILSAKIISLAKTESYNSHVQSMFTLIQPDSTEGMIICDAISLLIFLYRDEKPSWSCHIILLFT